MELFKKMYKKQGRRYIYRGVTRSYYPSLRSIVLIASEYDLDPKLLVDAFFEAWENKIAQCGSLKVSCREVNLDSAIFLLTNGESVAGQFPIDLEIIRSADFRASIKEIPLPEKAKKIDELGKSLKIRELKPGFKGINMIAEITEIPPTQCVITKWGSEAYVSQVKITDETGSVRLSLWNHQIKMVNIGDEVEIKNCHIASFANENQVRLGRKSTISVLNQLQEEHIKHSIASYL